MSKKKLSKHIVHCHFDSEPSDELINSLNKMADVAFNNLGKEINNGNTEKRGAICECEIPYFPTGNIKYCSRCDKPTVY